MAGACGTPNYVYGSPKVTSGFQHLFGHAFTFSPSLVSTRPNEAGLLAAQLLHLIIEFDIDHVS